jgi:hypothetical protein
VRGYDKTAIGVELEMKMLRTLVLPVEGPLSTPSAEGVGFAVALTG